MKGKLKAQEQEMARMKRELKESTDRASSLATKLNDLKLQNNGLTHKYGSTMDKLSEAEAYVKQLEDNLLGEQRAHQVTKDSLERLRLQSRNRDEQSATATRQLEDRIARLQDQLQEADHASQSRGLSDQQRVLFVETQEKLQRQNEDLLESFKDSIERLCNARDEDEASLFVARSSAISTASELDSRLTSATAQLDALRIAFSTFVEEVDVDTNDILRGLMNENKDLWTRVSKQQFEIDQLSGLHAAEKRKAKDAEGPARQQLEYLQQLLAASEDRLAKSRDTIDAQTHKERELEERMQAVLDEDKLLQQRLEQAQLDRTAALRSETDAISRARELGAQAQNAELEREEVERHNHRLLQDVQRLDSELRIVRESVTNDTRMTISQLRSERDDATRSYEQASEQLAEVLAKLSTLQRELDVKQEQYEGFKTRLEDAHAAYKDTLQEELTNHKALFEDQIAALQKELSERSAEAHAAAADAEKYRLELQAERNKTLRADDAIRSANDEAKEAAQVARRLEERVRTLTLERDAARSSASSEASRAADLDNLVTQLRQAIDTEDTRHNNEMQRQIQQFRHLEAHKKELEEQKKTIIDEVYKLRIRASDETAVAAMREKAERDRRTLQQENERVQAEFAEAQNKMAGMSATIAHLRQRLGSVILLQAQKEELQRAVAELPQLRQQVEEYESELRRVSEETRALQRERDEMSSKVEDYLEKMKEATRKDYDHHRVLREATMQVRRLDRQIETSTESVSRRRSRSRSPGYGTP
jgi:chromosome segregation ATPase